MVKQSLKPNQMQLDMFKSIYACKDSFKDFTPIEKLQFAQKAFLDVNKYGAEKFNYNQEDVLFGFYIRDKEGMALSLGADVEAVDIRFVLNCENPSEIYKALFHESRHIHQHKNHTFAEKLSDKYKPFYNKNYTLWALGPGEIDADNYAYGQMTKMAIQGVKKFPKDKEANQIFAKHLATQIKEFGHFHKVGKAIVKDLKEHKENKNNYKENSTNSRSANNINYFFNMQHIECIANNNPKLFSSCGKTNEQCEKIMQSIYDKEREDFSIYHRSYPFFMVYGEENWNLNEARKQVRPVETKIAGLLQMGDNFDNSLFVQSDNFFNNEEDNDSSIITNNEDLNKSTLENTNNNDNFLPQGESL